MLAFHQIQDMGVVAGILLAGAVVTKVVDAVRNSFDEKDTAPKWLWNLLAFGLGITVAFIFELNAFDSLTKLQAVAGSILTGFGIGASASGIHEFFDFLSSKASEAKPH